MTCWHWRNKAKMMTRLSIALLSSPYRIIAIVSSHHRVIAQSQCRIIVMAPSRHSHRSISPNLDGAILNHDTLSGFHRKLTIIVVLLICKRKPIIKNHKRRYVTETLPIRRLTPINQSINQSINTHDSELDPHLT